MSGTQDRGMNDRGTTDPGSMSSAEIEREVEGTRARLTGTIEELRDRVSPGQLVEQGVDWLRGSGGSEFLGNLGRALRDNPMPVALIGAGIAWLALSGDRGERRAMPGTAGRRVPLTQGVDWGEPYGEAPASRAMPASGSVPGQGYGTPQGGMATDSWTVGPYYPEDMQGQAAPAPGLRDMPAGQGFGRRDDADGGRLGDLAGRAGQAARGAWQEATGAAGAAAGTASDLAGRGAQAATRAWHDTADTASELAGQAGEAGRIAARRAAALGEDARDGLERMMHDQPLLLGALGLALGAAIGALLPRSAAEDRLMGEARDELADRAARLADHTYGRVRETAGEQVERVAGQAGEIYGRARERLDEAGISAAGSAEALGQVAREVREAVAETAREVADAARGGSPEAGRGGPDRAGPPPR